MKSADTFSGFHPLVNFIYFALVLIFSMVFMHPLCLAVSLVSAVAYAVYLKGHKAVMFCLKFMLPTLLLAVIVNPAFNHAGQTIICYFPNGNPLTQESLVYGFAAGAMIAAVLLWFYCYTEVMTSDKFVYLFGRIIPALSLVLSMTLRFVPKFKAQLDVVREAQYSVGRDTSNGGLLTRTKNAITVLSIMITWSLENAIETADSMKSRGYGLPKRTAFSIYRFDSRDRAALVWICLCGIFVFSGALAGGLSWRYFPNIRGSLSPMTICFILAYLALCLTPIIIDRREDRKWKSLTSEI